MSRLLSLYDRLANALSTRGDCALPTLARFAFAATLAVYYLNSGWLKLGPGPLGFLTLADGAYFQIFPRAIEAAGYDPAALPLWATAVVILATLGELLLPLLIVAGLFTRLAAAGMIGFVVVQSLTDLFGHALAADPAAGRWFDRLPDGVIWDQRLLWITVLAVLVFKGAGPLSLDRLARRRRA